MPCVLRSVPVAALDHLRGEKAFSLCRNLRHFPMPKSLCVTWLRQHRTWTACSTFGRKQGRKSEYDWSWPVSPDVRRRRRIPAARVTLLQWLERKSIGSFQVPSSSCRPEQDVKLLLCTTFDEGEGSPQSQGRREPSGNRAVALPQTSAKSHHENRLHGSPSVRPSPKAID